MVLIDTGPIVAFLDCKDPYHSWANEYFKTLPLPFFTCEPVLTEAAHILYRAKCPQEWIFDLLHSGALTIEFNLLNERFYLKDLITKYRNVPMDLADACMVRLAELNPSSTIFTIDSDFHVYRKNRTELIDLIMPT